MSQIRIAVIGAEQLDPDHHFALNTLAEAGQVTAFALDAASDAAGFDAFRHALQNEALDAVVIAGPVTDLRAWTEIALTEKTPIYSTHAVPPTIEEMIEIRRTEQIAGKPLLQFALTARYHDSVSAALSKAGSGEYGNLLTVRAVCGVAGTLADESLMFGLGAQMIDVMQAFAGPFQDVSSFADLDRTDAVGSESNVLATLRTHAGTLASLHVSTTQWRPTFRLELGYERGYLWLEGLNTQEHGFGQEALIYARTDGNGAQHETVDRFDSSNGALAALSAFIAKIADPTRPVTGTSQDAFDTLNTAHRILAADPVFSPIQERHAS